MTTSNGSLTFGRHIENLKFIKGDGYSDNSIIAAGLLFDVNMAFKPLTYRSSKQFSGIDMVYITITDKHGAASSVEVPIEVISLNSPPSVTMSSKLFSMPEGGRVTLDGIYVDDPDVRASEDGFIEAINYCKS